jgi:hypothetical protein
VRVVAVLVLLPILTFVGTVYEAREHRRSLPSAGCKPLQATVSVRVSPGVVRYARRQGWPRVLVKGGTATGDVLSYDHGREAKGVREAVVELCRGDRFRLVAAR